MYPKREEYNTPQYKSWRYAIMARDKFTCQLCQRKDKKMQAHHITRWADAPHLRYAVSNGICLCEDCHMNMVTGREDQFAPEFKRYVQSKLNEKRGQKIGKKKNYKGGDSGFSTPKWRPRNVKLRF